MKKTLSALVLSAFSLIASQVQAADGELCYPLSYGENGQGSTNAIYIPHEFTKGSDWTSNIYFTNVSDKPVNVKITHKHVDGQPYTTNQVTLQGAWTGVTQPIHDWTILAPGASARVIIDDDSAPTFLSGKLEWQADSCLEEALVVTVRNVLSQSGRYDQGLYMLNGGNPF